ncbi:MAG: collagen binding domain-containing protein [Kofleriaceae bacterium]
MYRIVAMTIVMLVACGGKGVESTTHRAKLKAAVLGLARDTHTGEPVAMAEIELHGPTVSDGRKTLTNKYGLYTIDGLVRGTYTLRAVFAGQPIEITKIPVREGEATYIDIMFTLGDPQPINVVFGDRSAAITRYRPKNIQPSAIVIEGTVSDLQTSERVVGAVVTAVYTDAANTMHTEQTITDDHGRYRFENLPPGSYTVSAYYSISGRAQVEMQRGVDVTATEAVIVPLVIELNK